MRSFALSSLIPLAFGIFASAAPIVDVDIDVGVTGGGGGGGGGGGSPGGILASASPTIDSIVITGGGGGSPGGGPGDILASSPLTIDSVVITGGGGGPGGISADVGLRRGYSGGGSNGDHIDIGALAGVDHRPDGEESLKSILCGVVSSVEASSTKSVSLSPPLFCPVPYRVCSANLGAVGCTAETLDPILTEVKDVLMDAINEVNGLKDLAVGTILNSVDGLLDATGLAKLLANVVTVRHFSLITLSV